MGSGKSTTGRILADRLNYQYIDTDDRIEAFEERDIKKIFQENGEEYFRNIETQTIRKICREDGKFVVALGGGSLIDTQNLDLVKEFGTLIYLKTKLKDVYWRLKHDQKRPLFQEHLTKGQKQIEDLLEERLSSYEKADHTIDIQNKDVEETVMSIIDLLRANKLA